MEVNRQSKKKITLHGHHNLPGENETLVPMANGHHNLVEATGRPRTAKTTASLKDGDSSPLYKRGGANADHMNLASVIAGVHAADHNHCGLMNGADTSAADKHSKPHIQLGIQPTQDELATPNWMVPLEIYHFSNRDKPEDTEKIIANKKDENEEESVLPSVLVTRLNGKKKDESNTMVEGTFCLTGKNGSRSTGGYNVSSTAESESDQLSQLESSHNTSTGFYKTISTLSSDTSGSYTPFQVENFKTTIKQLLQENKSNVKTIQKMSDSLKETQQHTASDQSLLAKYENVIFVYKSRLIDLGASIETEFQDHENFYPGVSRQTLLNLAKENSQLKQQMRFSEVDPEEFGSLVEV